MGGHASQASVVSRKIHVVLVMWCDLFDFDFDWKSVTRRRNLKNNENIKNMSMIPVQDPRCSRKLNFYGGYGIKAYGWKQKSQVTDQ